MKTERRIQGAPRRQHGATALALVALSLAASAGCRGWRELYIRKGEVHRHLKELREQGRAQVEARETDEELGNNFTHDPDVRYPVTLEYAQVKTFAEGCPDEPPFRGMELKVPCDLITNRDDELFYARKRDRLRSHNIVAAVAGVATLGLAGGGIYCGFECEGSRNLKTVGFAASAVVSALVFIIAGGGRD